MGRATFRWTAAASLALSLAAGCGGGSGQTSTGAGGRGGEGGHAGAGGAFGTAGQGAGGTAGGQGGGGTSGGGGATGGAGGGAAGDGGLGGAACAGFGGPTMVSVGGFCIDSTEVTQGQYRAWLATSPSVAAQAAECGWNTSFAPPDSCTLNSVVCPWETGLCNNNPQVCVDWCDAQAFCRSVGKRLCGSVSGGGANYSDPTTGQWRTACGGVYPYGDQYIAGACQESGSSQPIGTVDVGSSSRCVVLHDGHPVFDMSGNAAEWEDACTASSGAADNCRARGGSFWDTAAALTCEAVSTEMFRRDSLEAYIGFRCCS
jgi:formylglycine-generating enzyme